MTDLKLKVVRGNATADELAAILAVLRAATKSSELKTTSPSSSWSSPGLMMRKPLPNSWRESALPR